MGEQHLRLLVVKAHPHDFTHCAGTLGIHRSLGDPVTLVTVTSGAYVHNEQLAAELNKPKEEQDPAIVNQASDVYGAQKTKELLAAAALFGITDVRVLEGREPFRKDENPEVVERLTEIILEVRPHVLITQSPYLQGSGPHGLTTASGADDHIQTAYAAQAAATEAAKPRPGATGKPHRIATQLYPGVYFNRDDWDFAVDIGDWYEQRVQAEEMFESQGHTPAFARKRIEIGTGTAGWYVGTAYAEGFVRARPELQPRIVVGEYTLRAAEESAKDHLMRMSGEKR